ncbi:hypothetical protein L6164_028456 [Bauhinia variegata]|uniref:Uncharacterized protein n=1 Tax=Bauhinia variegata TaxID=167791 RepID=A0ACB9L5Z6_BAUVA|nr:hypothetical protein L6164_028456 [Bauhinia variegata]
MKNLEKLDLSSNRFSDNLPQCLSNLSKLRVLDLTNNMLSGNFPSFIVNLTSLEYISLHENDIEGTFLLRTLANHSKLEVLHLLSRSSMLQVETENPQWHPTFRLKSLILQRCNLNMKSGRTIPTFLLFQNNLKYVDLSHNNMVGTFPSWLMQNNYGLKVFILRNNSLVVNSFEGNIPSSIGEMRQLMSLDLSNNRFIGEIAEQLITNCTYLQYLRLSNNFLQGQIIPKSLTQTWLEYLYLNNNNFSGKVEEAVGNITSLTVMDISNNSISGQIPSSIGRCSFLKVLLMAENQLEGQIPSGLFNLQYLEILDLSHNKLSRSGPNLNLTSLRFLHLQNNGLSSSITYMFSMTSKLEVLDLRDNKFSGHIPTWISKFSKLAVLLLGGNNFRGHIPIKLCEIKTYSMLDLSHNKFNGSIPSCIANLPFQVPEYVDYHPRFEIFPSRGPLYDAVTFEDIYSNAIMKLNEDFLQTIGNPNICGPLLRSYMGNTPPSPVLQSDEGESKEGAIDVMAFYWSFAGAYVSILLGLAVVLCINVHWRLTWFRLVDRLLLYINVQQHMAWFCLVDRCIP